MSNYWCLIFLLSIVVCYSEAEELFDCPEQHWIFNFLDSIEPTRLTYEECVRESAERPCFIMPEQRLELPHTEKYRYSARDSQCVLVRRWKGCGKSCDPNLFDTETDCKYYCEDMVRSLLKPRKPKPTYEDCVKESTEPHCLLSFIPEAERHKSPHTEKYRYSAHDSQCMLVRWWKGCPESSDPNHFDTYAECQYCEALVRNKTETIFQLHCDNLMATVSQSTSLLRTRIL